MMVMLLFVEGGWDGGKLKGYYLVTYLATCNLCQETSYIDKDTAIIEVANL